MHFFYSWHPATLLSWWLAVFWVDIFHKAGVCFCNWWRNKPTLPTENSNHFDSLLGRKWCYWLLSQRISFFLWGSILCNVLTFAHHWLFYPFSTATPTLEGTCPSFEQRWKVVAFPMIRFFENCFLCVAKERALDEKWRQWRMTSPMKSEIQQEQVNSIYNKCFFFVIHSDFFLIIVIICFVLVEKNLIDVDSS